MKAVAYKRARDSILLQQSAYESAVAALQGEVVRARSACERGYSTEYASLALPTDTHMLQEVNQIIDCKKQLKPTVLVVVGIGGSHLGTQAVYDVLQSSAGVSNANCSVYFVDTIDVDDVASVLEAIEELLKAGKSVLLNVVTKSGTTTETIVNFTLFCDLLKRYCSDYQRSIVVTTGKGSPLWQYAESNQIEALAVPDKVGGRYSVFSPVGLFPLGLLGFDIERLCAGAHAMRDRCLSLDDDNPAVYGASVLYEWYNQGKLVHNSFLFSKCLHAYGLWYRQLVGESIGKKYNRAGQQVNVGIVPTVAIGSTDLHSVAQLYLSGPRIIGTTFVSVEHSKKALSVPVLDQFDNFVANVQGKDVSSIMVAIMEGVKIAYTKDSRPYKDLILPDLSEYSLGQLLQLNMVETIYLGYLLDVNPFDQPQVELYKTETRKILARE